jgi:uncharacterized protein YjbI with pentapeptide repeats
MNAITFPENTVPAEPEAPQKRLASPHLELEDILEQHREWLNSQGESGRRADLSDIHLEEVDLTDANLRKALLDKVNLRSADLLLADLRGASLLRANLRETNLLGAKLQETNLQGASLEGATGLLAGQFAGAKLFSAELPAPISFSLLEGLRSLRAMARRAGGAFLAFLLLGALVWVRIASISDTQLLRDDSALPFAHSQTALPLIAFHLFGPILLLVLYGGFHLYLQRMWDAAAALPAVFPSGQRLDACLPWFARWAPRGDFQWLRDAPELAALEALAAKLLLYWTVPATLVLFWGRYLTVQELRGSLLQAFLIVGATAAALYFTRKAGGAFQLGAARMTSTGRWPIRRETRVRIGWLAGLALILSLFSVGIVFGAPHGGGAGIKAWAADALWLMGCNPYGYLARAEISAKPANWSGQEEDIAGVKGARLDGRSLRYAQGYGAFLVKAHLWQADLRNAALSEADLREANMRQAALGGAVLDRAKLRRATLQQANLAGATLTLADLREANLSFAILSGAILADARLDSANLYKADLHGTNLRRASVQGADLREVNLQDSDMTQVAAGEAYLDSAKLARAILRGGQFQRAMLTDADLRGADLSESNLQGALLRGADLSGANLQGADLRGASGLNARQVCSAATLRLAQFDDALALEVGTTCPAKR